MVLLFIPLAMALPYCPQEEPGGAQSRLPTSVVYILDDSFSMSVQQEGTSAFEVALDSLEEHLEQVRPWDKVALVLGHHTHTGQATAPVLTASDDISAILSSLNQMNDALPLTTDLPAAMAVATEIHREASLPIQQTVIFTDGSRNAWTESDVPPEALIGLGDVEIIDVWSYHEENIALIDGGFEMSASGIVDEWEIWATVINNGDLEYEDVRIDLYINGEISGSTTVSLSADETRTERFVVALSGVTFGHAEFILSFPSSTLVLDDHYFLTLNLSREARVLLVNGDPRNVPYRDELFYLERALETGLADDTYFRTTLTTPSQMGTDLSGFDVVALANVDTLNPDQTEGLIQFVSRGGGLFLSLGSQVDPIQYNQQFQALLPKPLRSYRDICEGDLIDRALTSTHIDQLDHEHPIFRIFDLPGGESVHSAEFCGYILLEPTPDSAAAVIASFGDGAPALVELSSGAGRIILLTTTIDRDWSDWPIRTSYLPAVRRIFHYLGRRIPSDSVTSPVVGLPHSINIEALDIERLILTLPGGSHLSISVEVDQDRIDFTPPEPGHYEVFISSSDVEQPFPALSFSANLSPVESDLTVSEESDFSPFIESALATPGSRPHIEYYQASHRYPLWPIFLLLALALLFMESGFAIRKVFWRKLFKRGNQES
jgi:hypothetical protein